MAHRRRTRQNFRYAVKYAMVCQFVRCYAGLWQRYFI